MNPESISRKLEDKSINQPLGVTDQTTFICPGVRVRVRRSSWSVPFAKGNSEQKTANERRTNGEQTGFLLSQTEDVPSLLWTSQGCVITGQTFEQPVSSRSELVWKVERSVCTYESWHWEVQALDRLIDWLIENKKTNNAYKNKKNNHKSTWNTLINKVTILFTMEATKVSTLWPVVSHWFWTFVHPWVRILAWKFEFSSHFVFFDELQGLFLIPRSLMAAIQHPLPVLKIVGRILQTTSPWLTHGGGHGGAPN